MFWLGVHAASGLATDYNIGMLCFLCVCLCVFVSSQARDFISFNGHHCALMKRSACKCCDLAATACPSHESGHRFLGLQSKWEVYCYTVDGTQTCARH